MTLALILSLIIASIAVGIYKLRQMPRIHLEENFKDTLENTPVITVEELKNIKRLALVGLKGSGKDYIASKLTHKQFSFGSKVKDVVALVFNLDRRLLEGKTEESRQWRELPLISWSHIFDREITPRTLLQEVGTEVFRSYLADIWLHSLQIDENITHTVITDARFENEIDFLREKGYTIVLIFDGRYPNINDHPSEWSWAFSEMDYVLHNHRR